MKQLLIQSKLHEFLKKFDDLYSCFDKNITALDLEPFVSAFTLDGVSLLGDRLGGIGITSDSEKQCEGFYVYLNSVNRFIFMFEDCSVGGHVDFSTPYAVGIFGEDDLNSEPLALIECKNFDDLIETFVDRIYGMVIGDIT